jgi:hypothetical protein
LSKHRVVHLTDEIALAEIGSGVRAEHPFQPEELLARHCGYRVATP